MSRFNESRHIMKKKCRNSGIATYEGAMSSNHSLDILLEIIDRFPEGASLEEIMLGLNPTVTPRTVQRWLSLLIKQAQVIAIGQARARKYKIAPKKEILIPIKSLIPLSIGARKIEEEVSQPLAARKRTTYNRKFLEKYKPNHTYYLPEETRKKLYEMGRSEDGRYPAGTYAKQIFHRLLIDLSWNSSRLEGNTYSLLETERLLENGKAAPKKNLRDTQMILNHKRAIEFLITSAEEIGVNRYTILNLHTLLSENLLPDSAASGRLRSIPVGISHSVYQPPDIPQVIEECFSLVLEKAEQIKDPFEQAFFLMVQLPYLQPFDDVNKRTSRLAANIPLIRNNLCPLSFIDVPEEPYIQGLIGIYELNHIELLRDVFIWAYERSCALYSTTRKVIGEPDPFRMKYRSHIQQAVREVVSNCLDIAGAVQVIRKHAIETIPSEDQSRFIEIVERELQSLHVGNIARYQLRPKEFELWKLSWK